ncbi:hypothetical protein [Rhodococcus qingshengii]|uniref:hypothetical protein n=1 Tax=Rhodococcus qingshengii TaxID=334542 RepID=UPI0021B091A1|nr:hypothetical protein [Rhodococcus qingshengii]MCT6735544.1 hypothetical protein [Rhodococcus qingshengii]
MTPEPGTPQRRTLRMYIASHRGKAAAVTFGAAAVAATVLVVGSAGFGAGSVDAETAESFNARVIDDTVTYYASMCTALAPVLDIPDTLARTQEDAIGRTGPERRNDLVRTLDEQRSTTADAVTQLSELIEPTAIPSLTDRHPISYVGATVDLTDAVGELTPTLQHSADRLRPAESDADIDVAANDGTAAIRSDLDKVTAGLRFAMQRAKITTESTAESVRTIPACIRVLGDPALPAPDVDVPAAAAFHTTLCEVRSSLAEQGHALSEFTGEWAQDKTAEEIRTELVAAYRTYADTMSIGADRISAWVNPMTSDGDIAATRAYPDVRDAVVSALRDQAQLVDVDVDMLAATAEPELASAVETNQRTVRAAAVATTKATARAARLAPVPTPATQNSIEKQGACHR